jgi:adenylate cyclase
VDPDPRPKAQIRLVKRTELAAAPPSGAMSRATAISHDTVGSQGIYLGLSRLPPGQRSTAHVHTNCETALYVAAGQGRFLVGPRLDRTLALEAGDSLYVPPNAPHVVINDGDVDLVLVVSRTTQVEQVAEYDADRGALADGPTATPLAQPLLLDRCKTCRVPIRGPRAAVSRLRGIRPYAKNPQLCNRCESRIAGAEDHVVTILFADIRDSTARIAHSANEDVLTLLRQFFTVAAPIVYDHYGVIDQFLGDGLKVLFNVPAPRVTHSEDALRTALEMQARFRDADFTVGVGIETGMALAGHIGLADVVDFTCVGETVNAAARLQAVAAGGEIVIGPNAWRKVADLVETRGLTARAEMVELKGFGPTEVHRLVASPVPGAHDGSDGRSGREAGPGRVPAADRLGGGAGLDGPPGGIG